MANVSTRYEAIFILNPALGEEVVSALLTKFKTLIAENAVIEKVEEWGKRRLAYPIQDEMEGVYVLIHFASAPEFPTELSRVCKITDGVLRTLIVRNEFEDAKPASVNTPGAQAPAVSESQMEELIDTTIAEI